MNLATLIMGFVAIALVAGMIVFVSSTQSLEVIDTNGNASSATVNATDALVTNVTAVGGTTTGYLAMVIACIALITGVMFLYAYSRR